MSADTTSEPTAESKTGAEPAAKRRKAQQATANGRKLHTSYLEEWQIDMLKAMPGATTAEHIRAAVDGYLFPAPALSPTQTARIAELTRHMPIETPISQRLDAVLSWF